MVEYRQCKECGMPYGTLPPVGAAIAHADRGDPGKIVLPEDGKLQKAAEKATFRPTAGPVDLFAPADQLLRHKQRAFSPTATAPGGYGTVGTATHAFEGEKQGQNDGPDPFDDPIIGGRFTVCALLYGDYHAMHKSCINGILKTIAPRHRQLRVAGNAVCGETKSFLEALHAEGHIHTLDLSPVNRKKYPVMRQLFHDPANPIEDKWLIWFDDDSIAGKDSQWCRKLASAIIDSYPKGARMLGDKRYSTFSQSQLAWVRGRPWYTGRHFQTKHGQPAPNGTRVFFAAGGFWALETAAMRMAQIPDSEIGHNGGDYMVGEQLWQAGHSVKAWNTRKRFVFTSSVGRRGLSETHTAMPNWIPGGCPK